MSNSTFVRAFKHTSTSRLFTGLVIAVCIILLIGRFAIEDTQAGKVIASIIDSLLGTFVAALGIGAFLRYFAPRTRGSELSILEPRDLNQEFARLLSNSDWWHFKGNFGRYFRTKVLATLSQRARNEHKAIDVACIVIDPEDIDLCEQHAHARNAVVTADGKKDWTSDDVRREVYATIVCCFAFRSSLQVRLGLLNYFEPQRFDLSSRGVIVTREDRKAPALKLVAEGYFCSAASRDFENAYEQCRKIAVDRNQVRLDALDPAVVLAELAKVGLVSAFLTNEIIQICHIAGGRENPYG